MLQINLILAIFRKESLCLKLQKFLEPVTHCALVQSTYATMSKDSGASMATPKTSCAPPGPESNANTIELDGTTYYKVSEGKGSVLFPNSKGVFYNPVQEFNRDLSVSILRLFAMEYKKGGKKDRFAKQEAYRKAQEKAAANGVNSNKEDCKYEQQSDIASSDQSVLPSPTIDGTASQLSEPMEVGNWSEGLWGSEAVKLFKPNIKYDNGLRILEALAASGLRSIRYAKEVGGIKEIVANDLSSHAVDCMKRNIEYNDVGHLVTPSHNDASALLYMNRGGPSPTSGERFDVIDLDPYGSPHVFLDGAVQAIADGGLLLVTCTDMGVLCGNAPDTAYAKYGATSAKSKSCHEFALRIALQCLESHANRYGRYIEPLLSLSADFYIRVAVRVHSSQQKVKESYSKVGYAYHCVGCDTFTPLPVGDITTDGRSVWHRLSRVNVGERCQHCHSRHQIAGPIWLKPIHDRTFLSKLMKVVSGSEWPHRHEPLGTQRRIMGTLFMMSEELEDVPLYYVHDRLCGVVGVTPCKLQTFASAILNAGYRFSMSHCKKNSIKTDAPTSVVWDIVREYEKNNRAFRMRKNEGAPGYIILNKESETKVDFTPHPLANPESKQKEMLRFQHNPQRCWGPMSRSTSKIVGDDNLQQLQKRAKNQGRNRHKKNKLSNSLINTEDSSEETNIEIIDNEAKKAKIDDPV